MEELEEYQLDSLLHLRETFFLLWTCEEFFLEYAPEQAVQLFWEDNRDN